MRSLCLVVTTHGALDYAAAALHSAFACTHHALLTVVVDDASRDWFAGHKLHPAMEDCAKRYSPTQLHFYRFADQGGLLRSWNHGLRIARDLQAHYTCVANSDVLFTPNWDVALLRALDSGFDLVGPLTNAPGTEEHQYVGKYDPHYRLSDQSAELHRTATALSAQHGQTCQAGTVNGFCFVAKTSTFWEYAYDNTHVFCPRNDFNSRGQRNPTPLMTLGEYELQRRWHAQGLRTGVALGSFVFHYRSVSRGDRYKRGQWLRKT